MTHQNKAIHWCSFRVVLVCFDCFPSVTAENVISKQLSSKCSRNIILKLWLSRSKPKCFSHLPYSLKFSRPFYFRAFIFRAPLTFHYSRPSNFRAPCLLRAALIFTHPKILMKILIVFKVCLFHILNPICMVCTTRNQ